MGRLIQLWNEWEIQLLVLISFMLQVFLFFVGSLRRRKASNMFLRLSLWAAYLGADWVAIYILGFLSRQVAPDTSSGTSPIAFIWAPFLLIHLGGQDTITAFAIEDNNLWLRHFLNLVVQVTLALYVFWKSIGWHNNVHLLVQGIFLFVSGIVKYGERTMALKYGTLSSLEDSSTGTGVKELTVPKDPQYSDIICVALHSMLSVRDVFAGRTNYQMNKDRYKLLVEHRKIKSQDLSVKVLEVELAVIYDDLYTKSKVLRKRSGIIFRCISQACAIVALVLFLLSEKERYGKADIAITYVLFLGGFFLEVCAVLLILGSPWTWQWSLQTRKFHWLAGVSWCLLSSRIGLLPEKRTLWSNSMGQYDLASYTGQYNGGKPRCWKQWMMKIIRTIVNFIRFGEGTLFWLSKKLDTMYVNVDKEIMECVSQGVQYHSRRYHAEQYFQNLAPALIRIEQVFVKEFGAGVVLLHMFTEVHLSNYPPPTSDDDTHVKPTKEMLKLVEVCRKLSNYMLYLLTSLPEMLPASGSTKATIESFLKKISPDGSDDRGSDDGEILNRASEALKNLWFIHELGPCQDTLEEIRDIWAWLIIYAAGKSRPEMHAAQLTRGGELLSFAWLLMRHHDLGDSGTKRIELSNAAGHHDAVAYVFNLDHFEASPA